MEHQQHAERVQAAAAPAEEERRRSWRSAPEFQNRFRVAMLQLVLAALTPAVVISLAVSHSVRHPEVYLASPWVLLATLATAVVVSVLILRQCDRVSSRYCGPTFRIIKMLEEIQAGERPKPVGVRANDEFTDLVAELNKTFVKLDLMDDRR